MTMRYAVGIKIGSKADQMTVEAEDALIAALKAKTAHPEAAITYVRKQNARGDRRHPHADPIDENPTERAAGEGPGSRSERGDSHPIASKRHGPGAGASGSRRRQRR
jgi:hypothetical protein